MGKNTKGTSGIFTQILRDARNGKNEELIDFSVFLLMAYLV